MKPIRSQRRRGFAFDEEHHIHGGDYFRQEYLCEFVDREAAIRR